MGGAEIDSEHIKDYVERSTQAVYKRVRMLIVGGFLHDINPQGCTWTSIG